MFKLFLKKNGHTVWKSLTTSLNLAEYTTTIFIFTDGIFRRYLHYHSVGNYLPTKLQTKILRR
jgi:hypothetical protein